MDKAKDVVKKSLESCESRNVRECSHLKNNIKDDLRNYLYEQTKRNPMILPIIMEA